MSRAYVEAVLARDGAALCPLLDPSTRHTVDQLVQQAKSQPFFRGKADCAHVTELLIGYPHENMQYRLVGGRLLTVGRQRTADVAGRRYVGVDVRVSLRTEKNGSYAPMGKPAPEPTVTDTVWLTHTTHGWKTAKASLTLRAALNGDILSSTPYEQASARDAVRPPTGLTSRRTCRRRAGVVRPSRPCLVSSRSPSSCLR